MNVLGSLLSWSQTRPVWQQDAIRRLLEGQITPTDVVQVLQLLKQEHGLVPETVRAEPPDYDREYIERPRPTVILRSVGKLEHINALRNDQELSLAETGVTVVFGENGAGKTGYARVLKQVCRARSGADALLPNIYSDDGETPAARITYRRDGEEVSLQWQRGTEKPKELSEISIFDSRSASVYVTQESEVAYLPFGMDIFPRLSKICDSIKWRLEGELQHIDQQRDKWGEFATDTTAYRALQRLGLDGARAACEKLAQLTAEDHARLFELKSRLRRIHAEEPARRVLELRQCMRRITDAAQSWKELRGLLSDESFVALREADARYASAREARRVATEAAFSDAPLIGVGEATWQSLWRAARAFASSSDPAGTFPPITGQLCPLCMDPVSELASARMKRFEDFVRGELQVREEKSADEVQTRRNLIRARTPKSIASPALLEEIKGLDAATGLLFEKAIESLESRQATMSDAMPPGVRPLDCPDPLPSLREVVRRLAEEARVFEAAANPEEKKAIEDAIRELEARATLASVFDRIDAQIERDRQRRGLITAIAATNTQAITKAAHDMMAQAVTARLAEAFDAHCSALRLGHIPIGLDDVRGEKGNAWHGLVLDTTNPQATLGSNEDVLSEGEHRSIALAAFFAEVLVQDSQSTIVLDDPVSSLDHLRREHVARQLVAIAKLRPVVVFTHDLVLYWLLQDLSEGEVSLETRVIRRGPKSAGFVANDAPWDGQKVKQRLGMLKDMLVNIERLSAEDPRRYESEVRSFYGRLRDTWERAVEEILLQGAVRRFAPDIKTQSLRKVHRLTEGHLATLEAGMARTSALLQGHDHSEGLGAPVPPTEEVKADLGQLDGWVKEINALYNT